MRARLFIVLSYYYWMTNDQVFAIIERSVVCVFGGRADIIVIVIAILTAIIIGVIIYLRQ